MMDIFTEAYATLGLGSDATAEELETAYRRSIRRYPPELNPRRFARCKQAYELLTSFERRMKMVEKGSGNAVDLLFPAFNPCLEQRPTPPEPLSVTDWEPLLQPLRERAALAVLAKYFQSCSAT